MSVTEQIQDHQARCLGHLISLRMLAQTEPGTLLPRRVVVEIARATGAVVAEAEDAVAAARAGDAADLRRRPRRFEHADHGDLDRAGRPVRRASGPASVRCRVLAARPFPGARSSTSRPRSYPARCPRRQPRHRRPRRPRLRDAGQHNELHRSAALARSSKGDTATSPPGESDDRSAVLKGRVAEFEERRRSSAGQRDAELALCLLPADAVDHGLVADRHRSWVLFEQRMHRPQAPRSVTSTSAPLRRLTRHLAAVTTMSFPSMPT